MSKSHRQHVIARLLERESVTSQRQLVDLLAEQGVIATQATVSRDLIELGAVKHRDANGRRSFVLADPAARPAGPSEQLQRVLGEWVVEVAKSGTIVVVRTPPGCAHVVAAALDRGGLEGTIGTVAGDDTVMVVVDERVEPRKVCDAIRSMAGLPAEGSRTARGARKGRG